MRELGWIPFGVDISAAMLRYTSGLLPAVRADATRLPIRDGCLPAVLTVMAHTDMPAYPTVLAEAARVLQPGGISSISASTPASAPASPTGPIPRRS